MNDIARSLLFGLLVLAAYFTGYFLGRKTK